MKKYIATIALLAVLLASPDPAAARDFTPQELRNAAAKSRQINGPIEEAKAERDNNDIRNVIIGVALGVTGLLGIGTWRTLRKPNSSQPGNGSTPTQEGPTRLGTAPTDDQPTLPEAAESTDTGLDQDTSSLNPGHLLASTDFRGIDGVGQDGIGWDLKSVKEFATRAGKKAYRIDLTPSENEHFDKLVISIFQSETSGNDNTYSVKAAFLRTNPGNTISAPYLVSLSKLGPNAKLNRVMLCDMVESAMEEICNCTKDEAPVSPDLLEQLGIMS